MNEISIPLNIKFTFDDEFTITNLSKKKYMILIRNGDKFSINIIDSFQKPLNGLCKKFTS